MLIARASFATVSLLAAAACSEASPGPLAPALAGAANHGGTPASAGQGGQASPAAGAGSGGANGGGPVSGGAGTAGGAAGSATAGGAGTAGGGGAEPGDACGQGPWTCIAVAGGEPYGTHTFDVPAQQNWVNTGLFLRAGETASITESGSWQVTETGDDIDHGPCKIGDLVARIGLYYKDDALTCVHGSTTFEASKDGPLFVGALTENDLGETYESRADDSGTKSVTITSTSATVPTLLGDEAKSFDFDGVASGWVEVWGKHVILTLPTSSAKKDAQVIAKATGRLDAIYELERELRGAEPHHGQRIRFFPDGTQPGYMLAGNPVRMATTLVSGGDQTRISRAGEDGTDVWGFAHELGHDFSFAPHGFWTYQENSIESWPNLFSIYSLEKLGLPISDSTSDCAESTTGQYAGWDAWEGLCFLRQFQFRYGWDFYREYFEQITDTTSTSGEPWNFVHDKFEAIAGEDVTPLFDAWNVPRP